MGKRTLQQIWIFVNCLLIISIWYAAACLREQIKLAHHAQNGFEIDILAMSAFQPSMNTAAAVGLFTALLAVD